MATTKQEPNVTTTIRLPPELRDRIAREATRRGMSLNAWIREQLEREVKSNK